MSDPGAPWWAEVQHLRPREDRAPGTPAAGGRAPEPPASGGRTPSGRFDRSRAAAQPHASIATLEHEIADPWADEPAWGPEQSGWDTATRTSAPWEDDSPPAGGRGRGWDDLDVASDRTRSWDEPDVASDRSRGWDDEPAADAAGRAQVWDDSLEEAFAQAPSWTDDADWLLPKGAHRIENGRRTIEIRGQVDRVHGFTAAAEPRGSIRSGRRPGRRPSERFERRPDRVALWAFLLGVLLILVAAFSKPGDADAAVIASAAPAPAAHVVVVDAPASRR